MDELTIFGLFTEPWEPLWEGCPGQGRRTDERARKAMEGMRRENGISAGA